MRGSALIKGTSTACSRKCSYDIIGQKFGRWLVLKRDTSRPRYYICQCECGSIKSIFGSSLKNGTTKSCGCLKNEKNKQKYQKLATEHIGEKYGKLIIKDVECRNKEYYYKCECECGQEIVARGKNLFNGTMTSCGCINSKANEEMSRILTELNVPYKREYRFEDCRDKAPLPFDFALFNDENELIGLIECQGSQHYSARGTQWNTPERLIYTQKHDYIKQLFAEENHIPLLCIPYQFFDELKKFLITSDF